MAEENKDPAALAKSAVDVPSYIQVFDAPVINQNVDPTDAMFETLRLLHPLDPLVTDNNESGKFKAGQIVRGESNEVLYDPARKDSKPKFAVAYYYKEWVQFRHRDDPEAKTEGIVIASSRDPQSDLAEQARQWVEVEVNTKEGKKKMRKIREVHNFIVLLEEIPNQYFIIRNDRTSFGAGSQLVKMYVEASQYPMFAMLYEMSTYVQTTNSGYKVQTWKYLPVRNEAGKRCFVGPDLYKRGEASAKFLENHFRDIQRTVKHKDEDAAPETPKEAGTEKDPEF